MSKYSEWTNDQINREIATRLGYTFESRWIGKDKDILEVSVRHPDGYLLQEPFGNEAADCWRDSAEDVLSKCSDWAWDLNMAIALIRPLPPQEQKLKFHFEYLIFDGVWVATIYGTGHKRFEATSKSNAPALAICEAWLLWKDAQS